MANYTFAWIYSLFPISYSLFPLADSLFPSLLFFYNLRMQFLSLSRRRTAEFPPEAFTPELVAGEGNRVKELYVAGTIRQIWRRGDMAGAAIVWEAGSEAEVREALGTLPLAMAGLLEIVVVVPLEPYAGFGPAK